MGRILGYRAFFESGGSGSDVHGVAVDMMAELEHRGFDVEFNDVHYKLKRDLPEWSFFEISITKNKQEWRGLGDFFSLREIAPELQQLSLYLIDEMGCEVAIGGATTIRQELKWVSLCDLGERPSLMSKRREFVKVKLTIDARK
jgi:hypothetical protein